MLGSSLAKLEIVLWVAVARESIRSWTIPRLLGWGSNESARLWLVVTPLSSDAAKAEDTVAESTRPTGSHIIIIGSLFIIESALLVLLWSAALLLAADNSPIAQMSRALLMHLILHTICSSFADYGTALHM